MEEGQLADAKGQIVNFRNTIVIMTSNLGMAELTRQAAIGFQSADLTALEASTKKYEEIKANITKTLRDNFRPEFLNRLDHTIVFQPLGKEQISEIIHQQVKTISDRITSLGYELEITDNAIDQLIEVGFDPAFGARSLRRAIAEHVEGPVAEHILSANPKPGSVISIDFSKQNLALKTKRRHKVAA
jgi:ATP-dependent Clp protease ATP-binding subunit ClpC